MFRNCDGGGDEEDDEGHHDSWHCLAVAVAVDSASAEEDSGGGGDANGDEHDAVDASVAADSNSRVEDDPYDREEDA